MNNLPMHSVYKFNFVPKFPSFHSVVTMRVLLWQLVNIAQLEDTCKTICTTSTPLFKTTNIQNV